MLKPSDQSRDDSLSYILPSIVYVTQILIMTLFILVI